MVAAAVAMPAAVAAAPAAEAAATIPTDVALTMHVCGVAQLLIGKKAGCGGKATCNKEFCIRQKPCVFHCAGGVTTAGEPRGTGHQ
jgi:hypothetical protein